MVECTKAGFAWEVVYNWNVREFGEIYRSLKRNAAREQLDTFICLQQAFAGDKKSVKKYIDNVSVWLPSLERNGGSKNVDDFVSIVTKGLKLKK